MAGYALRSLSGEDATEADRLLSQHVPGCARCRETLLALSDTVADLAFAADPIAPPDTLLPRLHRELEPRGERLPVGRWAGVAAGVAVVLVAGGLAVSQMLRASDLEDRNALFAQALRYSQRPDADSTSLVETDAEDPAPVSEVTAPDVDHFFLVGRDVPPAPAGSVYGIWLSDGVDAVFAGTFVPGPGVSVVKVPFDRSRFDRVLITLEADDSLPTEPGEALWEAAA
ncbi:MAG TPA: anti-sigma factor [Actinomycetota bacterium]|nr:anti-sigma factor [Actinomycetota bacterium]